MGYPGKNTGVDCHFLLQGGVLPNPGDCPDSVIEPTFWALQVDSLPSVFRQVI